MIKYMVIALGIGLVNFANAQDTNLALSLEQAKSYALSNNIQIKNAHLGVDAAKKAVLSAIAQGLPQAEGSFDYSNFFNHEINFGMGGGTGTAPAIDYTLLDAGDSEVLKLIQGGGSSEPIVMEASQSAKIQVSQLLFSGQYWVGIQMNKLARAMSEQSLEKSKQDIAENVTNIYAGILIIEESKKLLEATYSNLQKTQTRTRAMFNAGMAEATDTTQLKLLLNNILNSKKQLERTLQINYSLLKFTLGVSQNTSIVLVSKLDSFFNLMDLKSLLNTEFSPAQTAEFKLIESQEKLAQKSLILERMSFLPTAVAFYSYNHKIETAGIDMNPTNMAGVSLKIPLFSSGSRILKTQESQIKLQQAKNTKQLVSQQLQLQEKQLRFELMGAIEKYNLQKENLGLSKIIYDKTNQKFELGVVSSLDLTQANNAYLDAQSNYLQSFLQLIQAKISLENLIQ